MSTHRLWLWLGTAINVLVLVPGFYMAIQAAGLAGRNPDSIPAAAIAGLFFALPVFCIAGPAAAWRAASRRRPPVHVALLVVTPVLYAVFLAAFLVTG